MKIVNVINFVRGCEPRKPNLDLVLPLKKELELCNKFGFKNTVLLQYDAMLRDDIISVVKSIGQNAEKGIWIEIVRPLCDKTNIPWNGRKGWDWDWYVNPGFLPAYEKYEKKLLIDEIMRRFKEIFGFYPKSAASWLIDSYSMQYMQEKYDVQAFAICREQFGIDAYTLNGGYFNGAYYPSVHNCLCPAQHQEKQINAPVFRLLGPDPIYNYGLNMYDEADSAPPTIEPVWKSGQDKEHIRWFFDSYFFNESLALSYIQLGQENSFGWDRIKDGLLMQFEILNEYLEKGAAQLMTLGESGEIFKKLYKSTPAEALCTFKNPIGGTISKSIWYNSVNYRINIVLEGSKLYIRDIYKFDENYTENFYNKPCKQWSLTYDNLPVIDGFLWQRKDLKRGGIYFEGCFSDVTAEKTGKALVITATGEDNSVKINLSEEKTEIFTKNQIRFITGENAEISFDDDSLKFEHNGFKYKINIAGHVKKNGIIHPENNKIVFHMI